MDTGSVRGSVPIRIVRDAGPTLHAYVSIKIGNTKPVNVALDTGSTGLQMFGLAGASTPGSGVTCTQQVDNVVYGDPPDIGYTGHVCKAHVTIAGVRTVEPVPFGLLTSVVCPPTKPDCKHDHLTRNRAMGLDGVLGVALGQPITLVNPILAMAGSSGPRYSIALRSNGGVLKIGAPAAKRGQVFHLARLGNGVLGLPRFAKSPPACLFINGHETICTHVLFDTGAPWPVMYGNISGLPINGKRVRVGTVIGFGAPGSSTAATIVRAASGGEAPAVWIDAIHEHANASIEAFLGKVFTYDPARATITITSQRQAR
jgi:hypothetical protein